MNSKERIINFPAPGSEDIPSVEPLEGGNIVYFSPHGFEQDTQVELIEMRKHKKCFDNISLSEAYGEFEGEYLSVFPSWANAVNESFGTYVVDLFRRRYVLSWRSGQTKHSLYVSEPESERGPADKQTDHIVMNVLHRALIEDEKTRSQMSKSRPRLKEIGRIGLGRRSSTLRI